MKSTTEVTLTDGNKVELLSYMGEYSIIVDDGNEELISSDMVEYEELSAYIRKEDK